MRMSASKGGLKYWGKNPAQRFRLLFRLEDKTMKQVSTILSLCLLGLGGCVAQQQNVAEGSGVALTLDYLGETDVIGFRFTVKSCGGDIVAQTNVDLSDTIFPGKIQFVEAILDEKSRHIGADFFTALEPGCYEVMATPISYVDGDDFKPSAECRTVSATDVDVVENQVTDVVLISQCEGDPLGALDTLVLLNKPPVVYAAYDDEKFNYECEPVRVCATVYDPNDDPLEVSWAQISGPNAYATEIGPLEVVGFEAGHRVWEQCAVITTQGSATHEFKITAWDLDASGDRIQDRPEVPSSNGMFSFPIHTNWIEEPRCWDPVNGVLVDLVDVERAPKCSRTTAQQFYCEQSHPYEDLLCDDSGTLIPEALYPVCQGGLI